MSFNLNKYDKIIRLSLFITSLLPSIYFLYGYLYGGLGVNPFATLMQVSGHLAMIYILVTLSITPLRRWLMRVFRFFPRVLWGKRLSDWNVLIRMRRMLGIYSFFYASIHLWVYCYLEMDFYWEEIFIELTERRFIIFGVSTWVCLLLLTLTSPHFIQRRMKRWWRRLHCLMYVLPLLAVVHHYLAVKVTDYLPIWYFFIIFILLSHRVLVSKVRFLKHHNDAGMESSRS